MRYVVIFVVAILAGTGVAAAKELHQDAMNADGLRKAVVGKALHFATPAGNLSIMFQTDGAMSASAGQLAAYTGSARDQGHLDCCRRTVPTLEQLVRRQVLLFPATAGRTNGTLDPQ